MTLVRASDISKRYTRGSEEIHAVESVSLDEGRGVIRSSDQRELVFSRNSVVSGDFEQLKPGGRAVLNLDDAYGRRLARDLAARSVSTTTFGDHGADVATADALLQFIAEPQ